MSLVLTVIVVVLVGFAAFEAGWWVCYSDQSNKRLAELDAAIAKAKMMQSELRDLVKYMKERSSRVL